jgi:hypothetical protein
MFIKVHDIESTKIQTIHINVSKILDIRTFKDCYSKKETDLMANTRILTTVRDLTDQLIGYWVSETPEEILELIRYEERIRGQ